MIRVLYKCKIDCLLFSYLYLANCSWSHLIYSYFYNDIIYQDTTIASNYSTFVTLMRITWYPMGDLVVLHRLRFVYFILMPLSKCCFFIILLLPSYGAIHIVRTLREGGRGVTQKRTLTITISDFPIQLVCCVQGGSGGLILVTLVRTYCVNSPYAVRYNVAITTCFFKERYRSITTCSSKNDRYT